MKSIEELNTLKEEVATLNKKLAELSEEELEQVTGGYFVVKKVQGRQEDPAMIISGSST